MRYGKAPKVVGKFEVECPEFQHVVYMPVAMANSPGIFIPKHLEWAKSLVYAAIMDAEVGLEAYVYLTVKHCFVTKGQYPNRPNWHSDGFGSSDLNYVWCNSTPTEFCVQPFNLSNDHTQSMIEMEQQAKAENIVTYPVNTLLRLDSGVIHRVAPVEEDGIRTFVKVSISEQQYKLKGNAHNYLFDYNWQMQDRQFQRNCPLGQM